MSIQAEDLNLESVKTELYERNHPSLTPVDIEAHAKTLYRILVLKKKHNVVMLGHNYMEPLVFGLSTKEEQGDSLGLSMHAAKTDAPISSLTGFHSWRKQPRFSTRQRRFLLPTRRRGAR